MPDEQQRPDDADPPALPSLDQPIYPGYRLRFGAVIADLTRRFVPPSGPSTVLQGELVRAIDKLWFEGQDNGNINWDRDFEWFCDLLEQALLAPDVLPEQDRTMARRSLTILRRCGRAAYLIKPEWARQHDDTEIEQDQPGLLPTAVEDDGLPQIAYIYDDLYQHLMDCAALFARGHPEPIPYAAPPGFRR